MDYRSVEPLSRMPETISALVSPGCLLVAGSDGRLNVMTIGWGTIGSIWSRPIFMVMVRPSRHTHAFLDANSPFTVNVLSEQAQPLAEWCGNRSGRDVEKFREGKIGEVPSLTIPTPGVEGSTLIYECRVLHFNELDPGTLDAAIGPQFYGRGDHHRIFLAEILQLRAAQS